jgi:hypothetical protein
MYLQEGDVPDNEDKRIRLETKIEEWRRDVVNPDSKRKNETEPSKMEMTEEFWEIESEYAGYWCEGEKCFCERTHWVLFSSDTCCDECMHDPCACQAPLIWDEGEKAYYRIWESVDASIQRKIWLMVPTSNLEKNKWF